MVASAALLHDMAEYPVSVAPPVVPPDATIGTVRAGAPPPPFAVTAAG